MEIAGRGGCVGERPKYRPPPSGANPYRKQPVGRNPKNPKPPQSDTAGAETSGTALETPTGTVDRRGGRAIGPELLRETGERWGIRYRPEGPTSFVREFHSRPPLAVLTRCGG
jgi:hypothetical protein